MDSVPFALGQTYSLSERFKGAFLISLLALNPLYSQATTAAISLAAMNGDKQALEQLQARAKGEDPEAEYALGRMFTDGLGVQANGILAASWLQKAAKQGHVDSQFRLGVFYLEGGRVQPDVTTAFVWLTLASNQGNPDAKQKRDALAKVMSPLQLELAKEPLRIASLPVLSNGREEVLVGSDLKCAQEINQALSVGGTEGRKRFVELVAANCGFLVTPVTKISITGVQAGYSKIVIEDGARRDKVGWVPTAWIVRVGR